MAAYAFVHGNNSILYYREELCCEEQCTINIMYTHNRLIEIAFCGLLEEKTSHHCYDNISLTTRYFARRR